MNLHMQRCNSLKMHLRLVDLASSHPAEANNDQSHAPSSKTIKTSTMDRIVVENPTLFDTPRVIASMNNNNPYTIEGSIPKVTWNVQKEFVKEVRVCMNV